ncbi:hypothetical protein JCM3774_001199 [Rhodotorula dairenensis]
MPPRRRNQQPTNGSSQGQSQGQGAVYGPRSALTSFLREQGITSSPAHQFRPRTGQRLDSTSSTSSVASDPTAANPDAGPSTASTSASTSSGKRPATATTAAVVAAKKLKKKPNPDGDGDFTLGGAPLQAPVPKKGRYEARPVGSFAVCADCGKKFTVSKYTSSSPTTQGGLLCQPCSAESIEERASFPGAATAAGAASKRPKLQKKKSQKGVDETLFTPVPTLQQACLALVSQYIHSVEALGDLGPKNLDKVSKIVSKNRALDDQNLKLFLDVAHREVKLYDCTKLTDQALSSISTFAPHLTHLTLLQCGRLDDDVLSAWAAHGFRDLRHLTLYAPYLVRSQKWIEYFQGIGAGVGGAKDDDPEGRRRQGGARPELETFQLRMSSRFDDAALAAFVAHNPNVVNLQLSELGKLSSLSLSLLHPLGTSTCGSSLRSLDLSRLGTPQGQVLVDEDVVALLSTGLGDGLERLVLDGNALLTTRTLTDGVRKSCHALRELSLSDCERIGGDGVEALLVGKWPGEDDDDDDDEQEADADVGDGGTAAHQANADASDGGGDADDDVVMAAEGEGPTTGEDKNSAADDTAASTSGGGDDGQQHEEGEPSNVDNNNDHNPQDEQQEDFEEEDALFEPGQKWRSPGLTLLNLHRVVGVTRSTLEAISAHSAHSLEALNLHSCDDLEADDVVELIAGSGGESTAAFAAGYVNHDTLEQQKKKKDGITAAATAAAAKTPASRKMGRLEVLDLSFVRAVDNFVVRALLDRCDALRVLFLHGNNRVTSDVPRKRGVHLRGLENAFYTEIPAGVPWEQ